MQTSPLMQLLQLLDNLYVVAFLVLVTLGIRILWLRFRKTEPEYAAKNTSTPGTPEGKKATAGKDMVLEIIDMVLIALILVFGIVRPLLLQTFFIPSSSMEPTLLIHDKLIANKFLYDFRPPMRGEVVVFRPPWEGIVGNGMTYKPTVWYNETPISEMEKIWPELAAMRKQGKSPFPQLPTRRDDFIKRVIGTPGDHIRIVEGVGVYLNGKLLDEPYLPGGHTASAMSFPVAMKDPGSAPRFDEFVNPSMSADEQQMQGQRFQEALYIWIDSWYRYTHMYKTRIAPYTKDGEFIVPPGSIFVMGDNRSPTGSFDSRFWGVVSLHDVRGRAVSTFWPLNRLKLL